MRLNAKKTKDMLSRKNSEKADMSAKCVERVLEVIPSNASVVMDGCISVAPA